MVIGGTLFVKNSIHQWHANNPSLLADLRSYSSESVKKGKLKNLSYKSQVQTIMNNWLVGWGLGIVRMPCPHPTNQLFMVTCSSKHRLKPVYFEYWWVGWLLIIWWSLFPKGLASGHFIITYIVVDWLYPCCADKRRMRRTNEKRHKKILQTSDQLQKSHSFAANVALMTNDETFFLQMSHKVKPHNFCSKMTQYS